MTSHLTMFVLAMVSVLTITMATGTKNSSGTIMKNEKKRNMLPSLHSINDKQFLRKIQHNMILAATSRRKHKIALSTTSEKSNSTKSFVENDGFNNNTKRWLESSYARGYHDTHPNTGGGLDEATSMYEDKSTTGVGSSRQSYFTSSDQDSYGNDLEAYLKPGKIIIIEGLT